jgi:WD40 repeat protein
MDFPMFRRWQMLPFVVIVLTACASCGTSKLPLHPVVTLNSDTEVTDVQFLKDGKSFLVVDLTKLTISKIEPNKPLMKTDLLGDGMDNGYAYACADVDNHRILVAKQEEGLACFDDSLLAPKPIECNWSVSNFYQPLNKTDAITMIDETTLARLSTEATEPKWKQKTRFNSIEGTHALSAKWIALAEHGDQRKSVVKIYSIETGELNPLLIEHKDIVRGIAFSPDESFIATASKDGELKIHDLASGKVTWETRNDRDGAFGLAIHPNQDYIAVGCLNGINVWSIKEKKLLASWNAHKRFVPTLAFSPDGNFLVSGSVDKSAKLWRMETVIGTLTYERP